MVKPPVVRKRRGRRFLLSWLAHRRKGCHMRVQPSAHSVRFRAHFVRGRAREAEIHGPQPSTRTAWPRQQIGFHLQVLVRDNNVDQALRVLKKRMQREGIFREMKQRRAYEKPSEKKAREKAEAVRRSRKLARKQAQRDGLLPMPKKVLKVPARPPRPSFNSAQG
jgi:small subunit ribosomal protein S21